MKRNISIAELLEKFEQEVIIKGISNGSLRRLVRNKEMPVARCKLYNKPFGRFIGPVIDTDAIITIDYYGYWKRSRGFIQYIKQNSVKVLKSDIIHFASIKIEDIVNTTDSIEVIIGFPKLKNKILIERGFRKKSNPVSY